METKDTVYLILRYAILVLIGLFNLGLFYIVFSPLTVFPVFGFLSLVFDNVSLIEGNVLFFDGFYARIIPACVAGAAYYLLVILNLTTPMTIGKSIASVSFLLGSFLFLNIVRIGVFAMLIVSGYEYFDVAHQMIWYFGSTLMIILIWFVNVLIFRIKDIPIYTDMKRIFGDVFPGGDK